MSNTLPQLIMLNIQIGTIIQHLLFLYLVLLKSTLSCFAVMGNYPSSFFGIVKIEPFFEAIGFW